MAPPPGTPWPPRRRGRRPAARAGLRRPSPRGVPQIAGGARGRELLEEDEAIERPRPQVGRRPSHRRLGEIRDAGTRTGVAAVQDHHHVGTLVRDLGDELGEFLVGQVPGAIGAAVVEDEGLVEMVGLDPPELLGSLLLRAMAAVAEQGDVLRPGLAEVLAEGPDDRLARRLRVYQDLYLQDVLEPTLAGIDPRLEVLPHLPDVVDAAPQLGDRRRIVIDSDQESVDRLHDVDSVSIRR